MPLKMRRATAEDIPQIWDVRTKAISKGCQTHYSAYNVRKWADVPPFPGFADVIEKTDFYVVEDEGKIVGCGHLDRDKAEIGAMFVDPAVHHRGIASLVLAHLQEIARQHQLSVLKLESTLNAEEFYLKAGFHSVERNTFKHPNGFELDCVLMQKSL